MSWLIVLLFFIILIGVPLLIDHWNELKNYSYRAFRERLTDAIGVSIIVGGITFLLSYFWKGSLNPEVIIGMMIPSIIGVFATMIWNAIDREVEEI